MRDTSERMITKVKTEMMCNIEEDPEWERNTRMNANSVLQLLNEALTATAEELFPEGVPANNQMKVRHWNSKNRELSKLITRRGQLMRQMGTAKETGATAERLYKLEVKVSRKQRKIREKNLRQNRDAYWTEVDEKLEEAYGCKDMKLNYKLIKEAHGPQMTSTTRGGQSLTGQQMKWKIVPQHQKSLKKDG